MTRIEPNIKKGPVQGSGSRGLFRGATAIFIILLGCMSYTGHATTYYNVAGSGTLQSTSQWGTNTDGSGAHPGNFTTSGDVFDVYNGTVCTIAANWVLSSGVTLNLGDGTTSLTFTVPTLWSLTGGIVNIYNGASLVLKNPAVPSFGTLGTTSTVVLQGTASQTLPAATCGNLVLQNAAGCTLGGDLTVTGNFDFRLGNLAVGANTLTLGGTVTNMSDSSAITGSGSANLVITTTGDLGNLMFDGITPGTTNEFSTLTMNGIGGHATIGGWVIVDMDLALLAGTLSDGGHLITVGGNLTGSASGAHTSLPGGEIFMQTSGAVIAGATVGNIEFDHWAGYTLAGMLTVNGTLTLTTGKLFLDTCTLVLNGTFSGSSSACLLSGSASSLIVGSTTTTGPIYFDVNVPGTTNNLTNFTMRGAGGTALLATEITVAANLNLQDGTIDGNGNLVTLTGNINGTGTYTSGTGGRIMMTGSGPSISGATIDNLEINTTDSVSLSGNALINGELSFTSGKFALNANTLTLNGTLSGMSSTNVFTGDAAANLVVNSVIGGSLYFDEAAPGSSNNVHTFTQNNTGTTTIGNAMSVSSELAMVAGTLASGSNVVSVSGDVTGTGTFTSTGIGTLELTGTANTLSGTTITNLEVNTSGTITLSGNTSVTNGLTLTAGLLNVDTHNLLLGTALSSVGGTLSSSAMIVANTTGKVKKLMTGAGSFLFPVGDAAGNYSPLSLSVTAGTFAAGAYVSANVANIKHPLNANLTNFLNRYWRIATSGITAPVYQVTNASYVSGDVTGTESLMVPAYTVALPWIKPAGSTVNATTHALALAGSITATDVDVTAISGVAPSVSVVPGSSSVCSGTSVTLTATGVGDPALTYKWAPATGLSATTGAVVTTVLTATATTAYIYTVTVTDGNNFTSSATCSVTVSPNPTAITGTTDICAGGTATLGNTVAGGHWHSSNASVASIDSASGVYTGVAAGTATIDYTIGSVCERSTTVVIHGAPSAITGITNICTGGSVTLSDDVAGGVWTSSSTTVAIIDSVSGEVTTLVPGSATISYATSCGIVTTSLTVHGSVTAVPVISSVSAYAAYPAASVTISGSNFNTTAASNIVYFGAVRAVVSTASAISLSVSVPYDANFMPVSVSNLECSLTGYSNQQFLPTYNNSSYVAGAVNFSSKIDFSAAINPYSVAIGDIDGDGNADIVAVNLSSNSVSVYRNTGTTGAISSSSFASKVDFATGGAPYFVAISDLDGDGKLDIAVANSDSNTISVLRNTATSGTISSSSFATKVDFVTGSTPIHVAIADVNGDGKPDLIASDFYASTISVLQNYTAHCINSSSFAAKVDFTTGTHPYCAAVADLDGDGSLDIVVANQGSSSVSVLRNAASGGSISTSSLEAKVDFTTGNSPYSVALADIDGDGKMEIITANNISNSVSVLQNTSSSGAITSSSFSAAVDFTTGTAPYSIALGDIDGDGKVDIAVANASSATVSVFRNTATSGTIASGSLAAKVDFATGASPRCVVIGDLNEDGKPDMVVANLTANTISVIGNNPIAGITGTTTVCAGSATALANATTGGSWSSSNTAVANVSGTGMLSGTTAGTATISYTLIGGTATTTVTVTAPPSSITGASSVCAGQVTAFSDATSGGTWSSGNATIATVSSTGSVSGITSGSTVITYEVSAACYVTADVTVLALPAAITGTTSLCNGSSSTLSDATTGGEWSSSNTTVAVAGSATGIITSMSVGTTTITYTIPTGCFTAASVAVLASPGAITGIANACVGANTTLADTATGGSWTTVSTSVATITSGGTLYGAGAGVTVVSYTLSTGCAATITATISPVPAPVTGTTSICAGSTTTLADTSTGGTWSSANTSIAIVGTTGVVSGISGGTATVSYSLGAGCAATAVINVTGVTTVSSLSIYKGNPAASVTITGTNFNSTAGNNKVFFGATRATVSSASFTSLTVTVPVGSTYMPVSVDNTGCSLVGYSQYPFLPGYNNSAYVAGSTSFSAKVQFTSGTNPYGVAIGDIDGDGKADMVAANVTDNTISVYRNTSTSGSITTSSFAAKVDFAVGVSPYTVAIGDLDGDGKLDIAVANNTGNSISVLRNTASSGSITTSSLAAKVDFATGVNPMHLAIGDLDKDGKPELVSANYYSGTVSVLHNTSSTGSITSASFATKVDFATASHPYSIAIGDLDGDGKPEMAVSNQGANSVSIFRNTSTQGAITSASFATKFDYSTASNPYSVAIGDIDGDGKPDLVTCNNVGNTISILRNVSTTGTIGSGSFSTKVDFTCGTGPYSVALGDFDGDGKVDIAVANSGATTISVFRNKATSGTINAASLTAKVDFSSCAGTRYLAVGDLDGDGKADIAVAGISANAIGVLRNNPVLHPEAHNGGAAPVVRLCKGSSSALSNAIADGVWTSSNDEIAVVDPQSGVVTALAAGRATIIYTVSADGTTTEFTTPVIVSALPSVVSIAAYPGTRLEKGQAAVFTATSEDNSNVNYQWFVNNAAVTTAVLASWTTADLGNGDIITCKAGNAVCVETVVSNTLNVEVVPTTTGVLLSNYSVQLSPNPGSGDFTLRGSLGVATDEAVTVEVVDMTGQLIYAGNFIANSGQVDQHIRLADTIANGMYLLNMHTASAGKVFHLVVQH